MRIPQKRLTPYKPQFTFKKNGCTMELYLEPIYCVNVISSKGKACYPLTQQQYFDYCKEADDYFESVVTLKYWSDKLKKVQELKHDHPDMIVFDRLILYYTQKMQELKHC